MVHNPDTDYKSMMGDVKSHNLPGITFDIEGGDDIAFLEAYEANKKVDLAQEEMYRLSPQAPSSINEADESVRSVRLHFLDHTPDKDTPKYAHLYIAYENMKEALKESKQEYIEGILEKLTSTPLSAEEKHTKVECMDKAVHNIKYNHDAFELAEMVLPLTYDSQPEEDIRVDALNALTDIFEHLDTEINKMDGRKPAKKEAMKKYESLIEQYNTAVQTQIHLIRKLKNAEPEDHYKWVKREGNGKPD